MEEALKVSIGGISFVLNSEAYGRLSAYLKEISLHYSGKPEGKEILEDVERRIAELLLENNEDREAVSLSDVEKVISVMGSPWQFEDPDEDLSGQQPGGSSQTQGKTFSYKPSKRLYRDPSDVMIGGVCSGLAHYFRFDVSFLRITLGILLAIRIFGHRLLNYEIIWSAYRSFFFMVVIAYIILLIAVPKAKTYSQKCQMYGDDPGVRGAEKKAKKISSDYKFTRVAKFLGGVLFVGMGLLFITAAWSLLLGSNFLFGTNPVSFLDMMNMEPWMRILVKVSVFLAILIPCVVFMYVGIIWLFNLKKPKFKLELLLFVLWLLSIACLFAFTGSAIGKSSFGDFRQTNISSGTMIKNYDTIYVEYEPLPETINGKKSEWRTIEDQMGIVTDVSITTPSGVWTSTTSSGDVYEYGAEEEGEAQSPHFVFVSSVKRNYAVYPQISCHRKSSSVILEDPDNEGSTIIARDSTIKPDYVLSYGKLPLIAAISKDNVAEKNISEVAEIRDSLIILRPTLISKKKKFDGRFYRLSISVPDSSVVIITNPPIK